MRIFPTAGYSVVFALALAGSAYAGPIAQMPIAIAPAVQTVADVEMTVSNEYGYANLRQSPGSWSKLLGKLPEGTKVSVLEKVASGAWVHVKVNGKDGYIQAKLLK